MCRNVRCDAPCIHYRHHHYYGGLEGGAARAEALQALLLDDGRPAGVLAREDDCDASAGLSPVSRHEWACRTKIQRDRRPCRQRRPPQPLFGSKRRGRSPHRIALSELVGC